MLSVTAVSSATVSHDSDSSSRTGSGPLLSGHVVRKMGQCDCERAERGGWGCVGGGSRGENGFTASPWVGWLNWAPRLQAGRRHRGSEAASSVLMTLWSPQHSETAFPAPFTCTGRSGKCLRSNDRGGCSLQNERQSDAQDKILMSQGNASTERAVTPFCAKRALIESQVPSRHPVMK